MTFTFPRYRLLNYDEVQSDYERIKSDMQNAGLWNETTTWKDMMNFAGSRVLIKVTK